MDASSLSRGAVHARLQRLCVARRQEIDSMALHANATRTFVDQATDPFAFFTLYSFQIENKTARPDDWVVAQRYSVIKTFRQTYLKLIREWEAAVQFEKATGCGAFASEKSNNKSIMLSNSLRRPLFTDFPRRHLRQDNKEIVTRRCTLLKRFVRKLLDAQVDLAVHLHEHQLLGNNHNDVVGSLGVLVRVNEALDAFLGVPAAYKEVERRQTAAILSLRDIDISAKDEHDDHSCCICLEGSEECENHNAEDATRRMVTLPCGHEFHDSCVIDWFRSSPTCPLCRQMPSIEASNS